MIYYFDAPYVEAFKWTADETQEEDPEWLVEAMANKIVSTGAVTFVDAGTKEIRLIIKYGERLHIVHRGDYIVRYSNGHISSFDETTFRELFERH